MDIILILLAVTLLVVGGIVAVLLWAVRSGQYDDLEGPAWRVLADDDGPHASQPEPRPAKNRSGDA